VRKVIACIDGTPVTTSVCDLAAWAALRLEAPLEFLHVLDRHPEKAPVRDLSGSIGLGTQESLLDDLARLDEQRSRVAQEHGRQLLEGAKARATAAGVTQPEGRQRHGALVESVLDLEPEARLFVLGQHQHGEPRGKLHLDHHVERVIRSVHRPVLVAAQGFTIPERFAIAFDGSPTGRRMVETVARSPLLRGLACHVVMAADESAAARQQMDWAHATLSPEFAVEVSGLAGEPEVVLHDYIVQRGINLLVMGAYGHSRIRQLVVGSTTTTMLRTATVAVLVLR
jgi:nucleotide-binding universal stress UspA family protein